MENKEIRVAQVLSETRVVLNVGAADGIKESAKFLVYSIGKDDIVDPVTGNSLGKLEYVRGSGHVIHLQEKLCTIETFKKASGKRIIRRNDTLLWGLGNYETEELPSDELERFDDVSVGDFAKLI